MAEKSPRSLARLRAHAEARKHKAKSADGRQRSRVLGVTLQRPASDVAVTLSGRHPESTLRIVRRRLRGT